MCNEITISAVDLPGSIRVALKCTTEPIPRMSHRSVVKYMHLLCAASSSALSFAYLLLIFQINAKINKTYYRLLFFFLLPVIAGKPFTLSLRLPNSFMSARTRNKYKLSRFRTKSESSHHRRKICTSGTTTIRRLKQKMKSIDPSKCGAVFLVQRQGMRWEEYVVRIPNNNPARLMFATGLTGTRRRGA